MSSTVHEDVITTVENIETIEQIEEVDTVAAVAESVVISEESVGTETFDTISSMTSR